MSMDTISDNTSGATDDTLRAAFEAAMRDAGWTNVDPGSWFGYRAGYEHGRAQAAQRQEGSQHHDANTTSIEHLSRIEEKVFG